jgi:hypothetical protein
VTSKPREGSEPGRRGPAPRSPKDIVARLEEEFHRWQALGLGVGLRKIVWTPGARTDIDAEVADGSIRVYVAEPEAAINAVRHEVLDYEISICCRPYVALVNAILAVAKEDAYRSKEQLVEKLSKLLGV